MVFSPSTYGISSIMAEFEMAKNIFGKTFLPFETGKFLPFELFPTMFNSNNLQCNKLSCWVDGTDHIEQASDVPSTYYFVHNFLLDSLQKSFQFIYIFFHNFTKIRIMSFGCPKTQANNPLFYFQSIKIILGPSEA